MCLKKLSRKYAIGNVKLRNSVNLDISETVISEIRKSLFDKSRNSLHISVIACVCVGKVHLELVRRTEQ